MGSPKMIIGGIVALGLAGGAFMMFSGESKPTPKKKVAAPIFEITLPPLPPPPPPPPPPPKEEPPEEEEQEMIEQEEVVEEAPPEPEAPADEPAALGTGIAGDGPPDGFGLSGKGGGGGGNGNGGRRIGGGGGRFGRSSVMIDNTITGALKRDPRTKNATFSGRVAITADATGRIVGVKPIGSMATPPVKAAISDVLTGLQFPESLPSDMPMPIQLKIDDGKPN